MALHELDDYRHHGIEPAAGPRTVHGLLPAGDTIATLNDGSTVPVQRIEKPDGWDEYGGALLATVELVGFLHPVDIAPDGTIIDGHRRRWIAQQLDIDLPVVCHLTVENEADVAAVRFAVNEARKPGTWSRAQWRHALKELTTRKNEAGVGLPVVEIAALMGTTAQTVRNHLAKLDPAELPEKRAGADGKAYPTAIEQPERAGSKTLDPASVVDGPDLDAALQADDDPVIDADLSAEDPPAPPAVVVAEEPPGFDLVTNMFSQIMGGARRTDDIPDAVRDTLDAQRADLDAARAEIADLVDRLNEAIAENERLRFVEAENKRLTEEATKLRAELSAVKRKAIDDGAAWSAERNRLTAELERVGEPF